MSQTSRIVEFWPEIEEVYHQCWYEDIKTSFSIDINSIRRGIGIERARRSIDDIIKKVAIPAEEMDKNFFGFVGGGEQEVIRVNNVVGAKIPLELADYLRYYCPLKKLGVCDYLSGTHLFPYKEIATYDLQRSWGFNTFTEEDKDNPYSMDNYMVIGYDHLIGLVIDIDDPNCPLYFSDAAVNSLQLAASSLANGLYLLKYFDFVNTKYRDDEYEWDEKLDNALPPSRKWQKGLDLFQAKLDELAPEAKIEDWFMGIYGNRFPW
jgi:hypothetical protein